VYDSQSFIDFTGDLHMSLSSTKYFTRTIGILLLALGSCAALVAQEFEQAEDPDTGPAVHIKTLDLTFRVQIGGLPKEAEFMPIVPASAWILAAGLAPWQPRSHRNANSLCLLWPPTKKIVNWCAADSVKLAASLNAAGVKYKLSGNFAIISGCMTNRGQWISHLS
jgi:hypothetical protein